MFELLTNDLGKISVSRETIETIAGLATIECYGLVGMVPRKVSDGLSSILGIDSVRKGVEARDTQDGLVVDVYIIVSYGTKISEVAGNVIQKVRYVLEQVTGIHVARVNVNVQGVRVAKE
ncbi:MAG: Asp23/Gls24 family envelope stress response protein [Chitinophagales bacterium]